MKFFMTAMLAFTFGSNAFADCRDLQHEHAEKVTNNFLYEYGSTIKENGPWGRVGAGEAAVGVAGVAFDISMLAGATLGSATGIGLVAAAGATSAVIVADVRGARYTLLQAILAAGELAKEGLPVDSKGLGQSKKFKKFLDKATAIKADVTSEELVSRLNDGIDSGRFCPNDKPMAFTAMEREILADLKNQ